MRIALRHREAVHVTERHFAAVREGIAHAASNVMFQQAGHEQVNEGLFARDLALAVIPPQAPDQTPGRPINDTSLVDGLITPTETDAARAAKAPCRRDVTDQFSRRWPRIADCLDGRELDLLKVETQSPARCDVPGDPDGVVGRSVQFSARRTAAPASTSPNPKSWLKRRPDPVSCQPLSVGSFLRAE